MALQEGQNLGPYRVLNQLGQGGMATVYKGYHPRLDRYIAIKVVHQAFLEDPAFLSRFEREAQIVAKLDHPHIVPVFDYAEHEGQPYLVMKYIEGRTLKNRLSAGALPLDQIVNLMETVGNALDYAHKQGILHRDIKPSNIIIDNSGTVYLTDFGLARIAHAGESTLSQDMLIGTPHYISPEQAMGRKELDARSDIYSLGVVLYELLVGRVPFSADTPYAIIHDHIYRPLPLPSAVNPEIPPEVERVLLKALAKDPAARYSSAVEMVNAFKAAVSEAGITELNPDRVDSATVILAQMRDEAANTPSDKVPSPLPEKVKNNEHNSNVEFRLDLGHVSEQLKSAFANWEDSPLNPELWGGENVPKSEEDSIRKRIEKQYKKRTEFFTHLAVYFVINLMLWLIYFFASGPIIETAGLTDLPRAAMEFPWPIIVMFGWGSGLLAHAVETYLETGERGARRDRAIRQALRSQYGENWTEVVSKEEYNRVRRRILKPYEKRKEFLQHVAVYVVINALMWFLWLTTGRFVPYLEGVAHFTEFPWPIIVMLAWGAGLVAHFVDMVANHGANPESRERAIQREMEREREMMMQNSMLQEKPKRERHMRLTADGEITDSVAEAWEIDNKQKRSAR